MNSKATSRVVKFRAWDTIHDKMSNTFTLLDCISQKQVFCCEENFIYMQFTGIKDDNDVEIYEGDILSLIRCPDKHFACGCDKKPDLEFTDVVVFEDGSFICPHLEARITAYDVIGNIYEHPNLLQKKGQK